jgi:hypothetical protein
MRIIFSLYCSTAFSVSWARLFIACTVAYVDEIIKIHVVEGVFLKRPGYFSQRLLYYRCGRASIAVFIGSF